MGNAGNHSAKTFFSQRKQVLLPIFHLFDLVVFQGGQQYLAHPFYCNQYPYFISAHCHSQRTTTFSSKYSASPNPTSLRSFSNSNHFPQLKNTMADSFTTPTPTSSPPAKKPKLHHSPPLSVSSLAIDPDHTTILPQAGVPASNPTTMSDTEVDLFPDGGTSTSNAAAGPQTPPRNDHLNATAPGELSPPRSQDAVNMTSSASAAPVNGSANISASVNGQAASSGAGVSFADPSQDLFAGNNNYNSSFGGYGYGPGNNGAGAGGKAGDQWRPGEWKNKKNQEEMARAWDYVVDKEWNANQYGDVIERGKRARGLQ
jgi:hypothetical protein